MKNFKKKYEEHWAKRTQLVEPSADYGFRCLHCYELMPSDSGHYHTACVKKFFGQLYEPTLSYLNATSCVHWLFKYCKVKWLL